MERMIISIDVNNISLDDDHFKQRVKQEFGQKAYDYLRKQNIVVSKDNDNQYNLHFIDPKICTYFGVKFMT